MSDDELVAIDLTEDERMLLVHGLNEYYGAAKEGVPLLSPLMGFSTPEEFWNLVERLKEAVKFKKPMSDLDWARTLFLTEICWASELVGAGQDFATNVRDEQAVPLTRSLQLKISRSDRLALLVASAAIHEESRRKTAKTIVGDVVAMEYLTDDERTFMVRGLNEYLGLAQAGRPLLVPLMGLSTLAQFDNLVRRLMKAVEAKEPLTDLDWARALLLTEIAWASDLVGSGIEFARHFSDNQAIEMLRSIQNEISSYGRRAVLIENAGLSSTETD